MGCSFSVPTRTNSRTGCAIPHTLPWKRTWPLGCSDGQGQPAAPERPGRCLSDERERRNRPLRAAVGGQARSPARCPVGAYRTVLGINRLSGAPPRTDGIEVRKRSRSSSQLPHGSSDPSSRCRQVTVASARIGSHRPVGHSGLRSLALPRSKVGTVRRSQVLRRPQGDAAASGSGVSPIGPCDPSRSRAADCSDATDMTCRPGIVPSQQPPEADPHVVESASRWLVSSPPSFRHVADIRRSTGPAGAADRPFRVERCSHLVISTVLPSGSGRRERRRRC